MLPVLRGTTFIYLSLSDCQIQNIQRVQNAAARLVYNAGKHCHITPLLFKLHWLPIRERILFKILLITYKAVHWHAPNYIKELIKFKKPAKYNLRSNSDNLLLEIEKVKTYTTLGDRAFQVAAPKLWNRPFSRGGHFESQGNKKLCFCPSSLALDERLDGQNLLFQHCVIKFYNLPFNIRSSLFLPSFKKALKTYLLEKHFLKYFNCLHDVYNSSLDIKASFYFLCYLYNFN